MSAGLAWTVLAVVIVLALFVAGWLDAPRRPKAPLGPVMSPHTGRTRPGAPDQIEAIPLPAAEPELTLDGGAATQAMDRLEAIELPPAAAELALDGGAATQAMDRLEAIELPPAAAELALDRNAATEPEPEPRESAPDAPAEAD